MGHDGSGPKPQNLMIVQHFFTFFQGPVPPKSTRNRSKIGRETKLDSRSVSDPVSGRFWLHLGLPNGAQNRAKIDTNRGRKNDAKKMGSKSVEVPGLAECWGRLGRIWEGDKIWEDLARPGKTGTERPRQATRQQKQAANESPARHARQAGAAEWLRAFRRAGLFSDDWFHFLLI